MIKLITYIILIFVFLIFGYWFHQNSGELIFSVFGYQVETSLTIGLVIIILTATILFFVINFFSKIILLPKTIKTFLSNRIINQTIDNQTKLINALCTKNLDQIKKYSAKLINFNDRPQLKEICQLLYKYSLNDLENLSNSNLIKNEVYKSLILDQSTKNDNWPSVISTFEPNLNNEKPISKNYTSGLITAYIKLEMWEQLLKLNLYYLDKVSVKIIQVIARYHLAKKIIQEGQIENAINELIDLIKIAPEFYYSFLLLIDISIKHRIKGKILNVVRSYFYKFQNRAVTSAIIELTTLFPHAQLYNFALKLHNECNHSLESSILLAQFALNAGMNDQAFKEISYCLSTQGKTYRLSLLMAEFCQRTNGNTLECIDWIKNALNSSNDTFSHLLYLDLNSLKIHHSPVPNSLELNK